MRGPRETPLYSYNNLPNPPHLLQPEPPLTHAIIQLNPHMLTSLFPSPQSLTPGPLSFTILLKDVPPPQISPCTRHPGS